jgi:4-carboxymuconolactone decarboxylase
MIEMVGEVRELDRAGDRALPVRCVRDPQGMRVVALARLTREDVQRRALCRREPGGPQLFDRRRRATTRIKRAAVVPEVVTTRIAPATRRAARGGADVDPVEQLLRRLALNDERLVGSVLAAGSTRSLPSSLDRRGEALVRVGALLSVGAATISLRWTVELAQSAGATDDEIVGVLVAIGPFVGLARVVAEAPRLALAMGYEIEDEA